MFERARRQVSLHNSLGTVHQEIARNCACSRSPRPGSSDATHDTRPSRCARKSATPSRFCDFGCAAMNSARSRGFAVGGNRRFGDRRHLLSAATERPATPDSKRFRVAPLAVEECRSERGGDRWLTAIAVRQQSAAAHDRPVLLCSCVLARSATPHGRRAASGMRSSPGLPRSDRVSPRPTRSRAAAHSHPNRRYGHPAVTRSTQSSAIRSGLSMSTACRATEIRCLCAGSDSPSSIRR